MQRMKSWTPDEGEVGGNKVNRRRTRAKYKHVDAELIQNGVSQQVSKDR